MGLNPLQKLTSGARLSAIQTNKQKHKVIISLTHTIMKLTFNKTKWLWSPVCSFGWVNVELTVYSLNFSKKPGMIRVTGGALVSQKHYLPSSRIFGFLGDGKRRQGKRVLLSVCDAEPESWSIVCCTVLRSFWSAGVRGVCVMHPRQGGMNQNILSYIIPLRVRCWYQLWQINFLSSFSKPRSRR